MASYQLSRRAPRVMRSLVRKGLLRQLPPGFDVDAHFNPPYDPWDQRLCVVPDGDLFAGVRAGRASVVTGRIERFTEKGLLLESGGELRRTSSSPPPGCNLRIFGGVTLDRRRRGGRPVPDGRPTRG